MSERLVVDDVAAENVRAYVEHVCANIPSRLAGTANGRRIAEYNVERMRAVGVTAEIQELTALVSFPQPGVLDLRKPEAAAIDGYTSGHSLQTPSEGVSGELVYVGSGSASDYGEKDVAGKIVLCEMSYSPARMEKQRIAGLRGAIGIVLMNWGRADDDAVPFGSIKSAWGNPTPDTLRDEMPCMPSIGVSRVSGLKLVALCARGGVEVTIHTNVENAWRPIQISVGAIDAPVGDDFVIVGGHQDSWYGPAATDNAAGNGCMIELARVFNRHRHHLRRGIRFGFWAAHETGTMAGSAWYVDQNWDGLRKHAVAYLLIDQPACTGTSRWLTTSNLEMRQFHQDVERRYLAVPSDWKPQKKGGDASLFGLGVPMLYGMGAFTAEELHATADANMGWWHHSMECTIDKVDFSWMQDHLRVYAAWLWELCTAAILPFDFVAVAQQFATRLEELARPRGTAPLGLAEVAERARTLEASIVRLNARIRVERERFEAGNPASETAASILNSCLKRLSNILIPIQSTVKGVYGHDPYGYTPQLSAIPCLYDTQRLVELTEGSEERLVLETHLRRQRNRVADSLSDALAAVDSALERLVD